MLANLFDRSELFLSIGSCTIFQLYELWEPLGRELFPSRFYISPEDEFEKLLFFLRSRENIDSRTSRTIDTRDDRNLTVIVCEYIEEIALLGMDEFRECIEGSLIESEFSDLLEETASCERIRPEFSQLILGPEELRHLREHTVEELLMRHRLAIWTPE